MPRMPSSDGFVRGLCCRDATGRNSQGSCSGRTLRHGGVFQLWGHSWEIEQERQWDRLEKLLATIAANKDKVTSMTNSELGSYAL